MRGRRLYLLHKDNQERKGSWCLLILEELNLLKTNFSESCVWYKDAEASEYECYIEVEYMF